jgi:sulfite exporter TauE/SafE
MVVETLLSVDIVLFLAIGFFAGAHCIGMCGPLVTIYASKMGQTRADGGTQTVRSQRQSHLTLYEVRQHTLFNLGRTASYRWSRRNTTSFTAWIRAVTLGNIPQFKRPLLSFPR